MIEVNESVSRLFAQLTTWRRGEVWSGWLPRVRFLGEEEEAAGHKQRLQQYVLRTQRIARPRRARAPRGEDSRRLLSRKGDQTQRKAYGARCARVAWQRSPY